MQVFFFLATYKKIWKNIGLNQPTMITLYVISQQMQLMSGLIYPLSGWKHHGCVINLYKFVETLIKITVSNLVKILL